jgi:manganese oxidase
MRFQIAVLVALGLVLATRASAEVPGLPGPSFTLTAKADRITTPDGNSIYIWGFASGGRAQYPAPTLIVNQGDTVSVSVTNGLDPSFGQRVSIAFPGQSGVSADCSAGSCVQGTLALEAAAGATVTYEFVASRPGTFLYNSGSRPDLQIEMGLAGALIVRPSGYDAMSPKQAYSEAASAYDQEYLFFLSEMDSIIHDTVEQEGVAAVDQSKRLANYVPNYWFLNGRNAPDTMAEANVGRLPTQPYNCLPRTHPGDRVLMRVVGGGHDMHPYHHHGNHARIIAEDGYELKTAAGGYNLSHEVFTIQSLPGRTADALFQWTGKDIGWDIYGGDANPNHPVNSCNGANPIDADGLDSVTREYCGDHNKPVPVALPEILSVANGEFWSGSPFLGTMGALLPGEGGLNPNAGYTYMWHSHTEKEITNYDIFPGGMMTMLIIEPRGVVIP